MTFFVDRYNVETKTWTTLFAAEHYIDPNSFSGPQEMFPSSESPENARAFAGRPGWKSRVRFNDATMAIYAWDKVPENPRDEDSFMKWGWELIERFPVAIPPEKMASLELSVI
jgi:hypothetical protein